MRSASINCDLERRIKRERKPACKARSMLSLEGSTHPMLRSTLRFIFCFLVDIYTQHTHTRMSIYRVTTICTVCFWFKPNSCSFHLVMVFSMEFHVASVYVKCWFDFRNDVRTRESFMQIPFRLSIAESNVSFAILMHQ